MRHLYLLFLFFPMLNVLGQLSISPSETGSSFVYAKDIVLYVEEEINLEKNANLTTTASIYLRKESQLIQGDKLTNLNTGNGQISLFQEGTANAFNYNYWNLPVIAENNIRKNIYEPLDKTESRQVILTPNLEGKARPLTISSRWIYKFAGGEYEDWRYVGNDFDVAPGEGFTMKGVTGTNVITVEGVQNNPGNQQRYDFRGLPNDGEIKLSILKDQVLLVGNPYPSALNLKDFLIENTFTTGIAYFWDYTENLNSHYLKDYEGGYGAYSPGANTYAPAVFKTYNGGGDETGNSGETGKNYAREFAPVAQGFMVIGKNNGQVIFKNSHRQFVKENSASSQFRSSDDEIPLLKLNIDFNEIYTRQLVLAFREDSSPKEDHAMDAQSFGALSTDAGWLINEKAFLINVLPFSEEEKIPLLISAEKESFVKITIGELQNIPQRDISLYDTETNKYHNLLKNAFKINLPAGNYENRFSLVFKDEKPREIEEFLFEKELEIQEKIEVLYNQKLRQIEIYSKELIEELQLFDINGGLIFNKKIYENKQYHYFYTGNLPNAVYIVKVKAQNQEVFSKKLLLKK